MIEIFVDDSLVSEVGRNTVVVSLATDYEQISETEAIVTYGGRKYKAKIEPYWSKRFQREMHCSTLVQKIKIEES